MIHICAKKKHAVFDFDDGLVPRTGSKAFPITTHQLPTAFGKVEGAIKCIIRWNVHTKYWIIACFVCHNCRLRQWDYMILHLREKRYVRFSNLSTKSVNALKACSLLYLWKKHVRSIKSDICSFCWKECLKVVNVKKCVFKYLYCCAEKKCLKSLYEHKSLTLRYVMW